MIHRSRRATGRRSRRRIRSASAAFPLSASRLVPASPARRQTETPSTAGCSTGSNSLSPRQFRREPTDRLLQPRHDTGCSEVQLNVSNRSAAGVPPGSRGTGARSTSEAKRSAAGISPCSASTNTARTDALIASRTAPGRPRPPVHLAQRHHIGRLYLRPQQRIVQHGHGRCRSTTHSTVSNGASRQITGSMRLRTMSVGSATRWFRSR